MSKMVSLKLTKKEQKTTDIAPAEAEQPSFPWGTSINLEDELLEKLGINLEDFSIGDTGSTVINYEIKGMNQSEREDHTHKSLELQITHMGPLVESDVDEQEEDPETDWDDDKAKVDRDLKKRGY